MSDMEVRVRADANILPGIVPERSSGVAPAVQPAVQPAETPAPSLAGKAKAELSHKAEMPAVTSGQVFKSVPKELVPAAKPMTARKVAPATSWGTSIQAAFSALGNRISTALHDAKMSLTYTFSLSKEQREVVDSLKNSATAKEGFDAIKGKLQENLQVGKLQDLVEEHMDLLQHTCGAKFTQGLVSHLACTQAGRESQWVHSLAIGLSKSTGVDLSSLAEQIAHNPKIPEEQRVAVFAFRASAQLEQAGKAKNPILQQIVNESFTAKEREILGEIRELTANPTEFGESAMQADFSAAKSGIDDDGVREQSKLILGKFDLVKNLIGEKQADKLMMQRLYLAFFTQEKGEQGAVESLKTQLLKEGYTKEDILEVVNSPLGKERLTGTFTGITIAGILNTFKAELAKDLPATEVDPKLAAKAEQTPWKTI